MTRPLLLTLVSLLITVPLVAQPQNDVREWMHEEVLPTLKTWHDEYDASLSPADLQKLNELRAEAKALRDKIHEMEPEQRREAHKEIREQMREIMKQVKPIVKESRDKLRELYDENEDQIEEWRDELHERVREMKEELREAKRERRAERDDRGDRGDRGDRERRSHRKHDRMDGPAGLILSPGQRSALHFVLWDGEIPSNPDQGSRPMGIDRVNKAQLNVTPNPSQDEIRVNATNVPTGAAKVQVFDMNGHLLRSVDAPSSNGMVDLDIPTSGLTPGTYMVSINTAKGRTSKTVIISK